MKFHSQIYHNRLGFPILQTYSLSGDFSVWEKIVRSLRENIVLYLNYLNAVFRVYCMTVGDIVY